MSLDEMIAVMQHYRDGGEVEVENYDGNWVATPEPSWDFSENNYRIKEKPKTKTVWFWRVLTEESGWFMPDYMYTREEVADMHKKATEFKRMDALGYEEVTND